MAFLHVITLTAFYISPQRWQLHFKSSVIKHVLNPSFALDLYSPVHLHRTLSTMGSPTKGSRAKVTMCYRTMKIVLSNTQRAVLLMFATSKIISRSCENPVSHPYMSSTYHAPTYSFLVACSNPFKTAHLRSAVLRARSSYDCRR